MTIIIITFSIVFIWAAIINADLSRHDIATTTDELRKTYSFEI